MPAVSPTVASSEVSKTATTAPAWSQSPTAALNNINHKLCYAGGPIAQLGPIWPIGNYAHIQSELVEETT